MLRDYRWILRYGSKTRNQVVIAEA